MKRRAYVIFFIYLISLGCSHRTAKEYRAMDDDPVLGIKIEEAIGLTKEKRHREILEEYMKTHNCPMQEFWSTRTVLR